MSTSSNIEHQPRTTTNTTNIHIDRLRVVGPCYHRPIGQIAHYPNPERGSTGVSAMAVTGGSGRNSPTYYVRSRGVRSPAEAAELELHYCPPQLLQGHNVFGHDNLIAYACDALEWAIAENQIQLLMDADPMEAWSLGRFKVTEVHLTGNLGLLHEYVLPAIQATDENNGAGKHRDALTALTLGFTPMRRSKYRAVTIYDKYVQLLKLWPNPGPLQQRILDYIKNSIRVEIKLYSQGLARLGLNDGSAWRDLDVGALFFDSLAQFNVHHAIQRKLTDDELAMLTRGERKAYLLWLNGVSIFDQFASPSAAYKYINSIFEKTGIDISGNRRPEALPAFNLADILVPENVLPVPDWLRDTPRFVPPTCH
jgi:hypothetical protein